MGLGSGSFGTIQQRGSFERGMCLFRRDLHWFETIEQRRVGFDNAGEPLVTNINVVVTIPEDEQTEAERRYDVYKHRDSPEAFNQQRAQWYVQDFSKGHVVAWWGESQFYEDSFVRSSKRLDQALIG